MSSDQNSTLIINAAFTVADNNAQIGHGVFDCGFSIENRKELFFSHFVFTLPETAGIRRCHIIAAWMYYNGFLRKKPEKPKIFLKKVVVNSQQVSGKKCAIQNAKAFVTLDISHDKPRQRTKGKQHITKLKPFVCNGKRTDNANKSTEPRNKSNHFREISIE
jgi:hypothetical protein